MTYDTLVLSGGSIKGFGHLGAVQYLQDIGYLCQIRKFIGTSIGGVLCYLFCIGYSPIEIMIYLNQQSTFFENIQKVDLVNLVNGMGALPFSLIQDLLEKMTVNKIKKYITMKDILQVYGKELILLTYNETLEKEEILSSQTHPDLPCITALRMTCNLPFLFEPFIYGDYSYMDGGVLNNFPINLVDPEDFPIGIHFKGETPVRGNNNHEKNILNRILGLVRIMMRSMEENKIEKARPLNPHLTLISIPTRVGIVSFSLTSKEKFDLFSLGYEKAKGVFQTPANSGSCFSNTL